MRAALAAVALLASLPLAPPAAHAHGEASWIMADPRTAWYCGPRDCRPLADREVRRTAQGWSVNGRPVPAHAVYPTKDGTARFWACFMEPALVEPRCLFLPALF